MQEAQIVQGVQLLDLMLEYFADDGHWTRGRYDDGNGGHCLDGDRLKVAVGGTCIAASMETVIMPFDQR
jgi:hypothetical protein